MRRCFASSIFQTDGSTKQTCLNLSCGLQISPEDIFMQIFPNVEVFQQNIFHQTALIDLHIAQKQPFITSFDSQKYQETSLSQKPTRIYAITLEGGFIHFSSCHSEKTQSAAVHSNNLNSLISCCIYPQHLQSLSILRSYKQFTEDMQNHLKHKSSLKELINDLTVDQIKWSLKRVLNEINKKNRLLSYSLYILHKEAIYLEVTQGVSENLAKFLFGNTEKFSEKLLRSGESEIFSEAPNSKSISSFQLMQQLHCMHSYKNFPVLSTGIPIKVTKLEGERIYLQKYSQIIPLTEKVISDNTVIICAFLKINEFCEDNTIKTTQSLISSTQNLTISPILSTSLIPSSPNTLSQLELTIGQQALSSEGYHQNVEDFRSKFYGRQQISHKKRFRKTKAQVEEELKFYLAINLNHRFEKKTKRIIKQQMD